MKNKHDLQQENKKVKQLELKQTPSSNADNDNQNQYHNSRVVALGPNTRRQG